MSDIQKRYEELKAKNLSIDMTRGKPSEVQLDLSSELLNLEIPFIGDDGVDVRNYGLLEGITEARKLMGELMEEPAENVFVVGSSSLTLMYDTVARAMQFGFCGEKPWNELDTVKFLCPVPGYDRHFKICENFGIEMINVEMKECGPCMETVEELVAEDTSIKGIWCVPQYSNPTGVTYSDETVQRLASMKTAARDFRIFWDNAYCVHHLFDEEDEQDHVLDIGSACREAKNDSRFFKFSSLSKVTFPGAAIAAIAASPENMADAKVRMTTQMIGSDKINQMKHALFLKNKAGVLEHMKRHAELLRPKFEVVDEVLTQELGDADYCSWSKPKGGYFISFNCKPSTAKRVVEIAAELGVKFTQAGATFPHGDDPSDQNIRIAPSLPPIEDVKMAAHVLAVAAKIEGTQNTD